MFQSLKHFLEYFEDFLIEIMLYWTKMASGRVIFTFPIADIPFLVFFTQNQEWHLIPESFSHVEVVAPLYRISVECMCYSSIWPPSIVSKAFQFKSCY